MAVAERQCIQKGATGSVPGRGRGTCIKQGVRGCSPGGSKPRSIATLNPKKKHKHQRTHINGCPTPASHAIPIGKMRCKRTPKTWSQASKLNNVQAKDNVSSEGKKKRHGNLTSSLPGKVRGGDSCTLQAHWPFFRALVRRSPAWGRKRKRDARTEWHGHPARTTQLPRKSHPNLCCPQPVPSRRKGRVPSRSDVGRSTGGSRISGCHPGDQVGRRRLVPT